MYITERCEGISRKERMERTLPIEEGPNIWYTGSCLLEEVVEAFAG